MKLSGSTLWLRIFFLLIPLSFIVCSNSPLTGGSGTEVSIAGKVVNPEGRPVENALVRLRPTSFISDSIRSVSYCATHSIFDTLTGNDGSFIFSKLFYDDYTVEVLCNETLGSVEQVRIDETAPRSTISAVPVFPLSKISGSVNLYYNTEAPIIVQVYGIDRFARADNRGSFSLLVPPGLQKLHIAAYAKNDTTSHLFELDGLDISLTVLPDEERDAGVFHLRHSPSQPCNDGECDSMVIRSILEASGSRSIPLSSVSRTNDKGRIVELNLRRLNFSKGIHFDIIKLCELQILDIGNTNLPMMFPDIGMMQNLEVIRADSNKLSFFSSSIGNIESLKELNLNDNELTELPQSIIKCRELSKIYISGNQLCEIDTVVSEWLDTIIPDWRDNQRCQ